MVIIFSISTLFVNAASGDFRDMDYFKQQDTVILASVKQSLEIKSGNSVIELQMKIDNAKINKGGKRFILLKGLSMEKAPEGVYEIYLTDKKYPEVGLTPNGNFFVGVIDTYGPDKKEELFQLPTKSNSLFEADISCHFVYIVFRGNILPDNKKSLNAGHLTIKEVEIIQTSFR